MYASLFRILQLWDNNTFLYTLLKWKKIFFFFEPCVKSLRYILLRIIKIFLDISLIIKRWIESSSQFAHSKTRRKTHHVHPYSARKKVFPAQNIQQDITPFKKPHLLMAKGHISQPRVAIFVYLWPVGKRRNTLVSQSARDGNRFGCCYNFQAAKATRVITWMGFRKVLRFGKLTTLIRAGIKFVPIKKCRKLRNDVSESIRWLSVSDPN